MEYKFSKENFEKIKQLAFDLELKADSLRQMAINLQYDLSDNSINTEQEILIETYRPWVKKLGQWHLADDDGKTRCRFFNVLYFIAYTVLLIPCGNGAAFKQL